jgi:hypothetical protein
MRTPRRQDRGILVVAGNAKAGGAVLQTEQRRLAAAITDA